MRPGLRRYNNVHEFRCGMKVQAKKKACPSSDGRKLGWVPKVLGDSGSPHVPMHTCKHGHMCRPRQSAFPAQNLPIKTGRIQPQEGPEGGP